MATGIAVPLAVAALAAAGALAAGPEPPAAGDPLPRVIPNDNRTPAGRLRGDTLELALEIRLARWFPEADSGPAVEVAAFAEAGGPPVIPAPLIRVAEGTVIVARVHNRLPDSAVTVRGLAAADSLVLAPGESGTVRFAAGAPGTYAYAATVGARKRPAVAVPLPLRHVQGEREQLAGAFIVDPPGGSPPDRVFVMNIWGNPAAHGAYANALAINGRSWPWTERLHAATGDTLRWRVINATSRTHPMHLHGFYFRLDALGRWGADSSIPAADRQLAVTHQLRPYESMLMTWSPDRPGNWLFHCHLAFHVLPTARVTPVDDHHADWRDHHPERHMSGLIMGISVDPGAGWRAEERRDPERLRLFIQEGPPKGRTERTLSAVLQRGAAEPAPDSVELPASALVLTRGRPTDITVINRAREAAVIHWHGIELESYSDGVAGWSGAGSRLAPSIEPGDSFVARLSLPRTGTFIYHTHLNDIDQLTSGLYGGIVVIDPDTVYDATRDHLFVAGWDGLERDSAGTHSLVNGERAPAPLTISASVVHRLRFVNIGPADIVRFELRRDTSLVTWRVVAKDGADLPAHLAEQQPAARIIDVGETFDADVLLPPGEYRLVAQRNGPFPFYERRVVAR